MKIAFAGKGGVGKTTVAAWTADLLARQGKNVWMVDADTALSLGQASGLSRDELPESLVRRQDLIRSRIGSGGILHLNPEVGDIPESVAVDVATVRRAETDEPGRRRLVVMGTMAGAGGGCACEANALLKAVLAHLVLERNEWVIVDLEAGVEHLGRGTVAGVDGLVVVSEPSSRSLETAATIGTMARELGLTNQILVLNRHDGSGALPRIPGLPERRLAMPYSSHLAERQFADPSVVGLPAQGDIDKVITAMVETLQASTAAV